MEIHVNIENIEMCYLVLYFFIEWKTTKTNEKMNEKSIFLPSRYFWIFSNLKRKKFNPFLATPGMNSNTKSMNITIFQ